ncbi:MAG: aminopeptidase P family protein [Odoribacter sp.]
MTVIERVSALREIMDRECIDAYIVAGTDPHNSEYLPATWMQREWISGFTGSFGNVVILKDQAGLWTDTRYFIQAEQQLKGTGIEMHKLRVAGAVDYPDWLASHLPEGSRVGLDSFCISVSEMKHLQAKLSAKGIKVVEKTDLLGDIWLDRPALPESTVFQVPESTAGRSASDKINLIRRVLNEKNADYYLFSCLDEIAWLFNIRCNDIDYNPVAISYAIIGKEKAILFIKRPKVSREVSEKLQKEGIEIEDYHHLFLLLDEWDKKARFCVDADTLNFAVYNKVSSLFQVEECGSPIVLAKSVKNQVEINGFRKACEKDSVAMTKFFYWLENNIGNHLTETAASDQLTALRAQDSEYISDSFENISAYGENAALPHYSAIPGKDAELKPKGLYLVDSGGQYTHGTTDITRTVPLGDLTYLEKEDYTLVLKGMIALGCSRFPKGTKGCNLDILARQPLWQACRNYGHGTGHGIGFFLNVHEGPQSIRQELKDQVLLPGMVTSDEPGIYREGFHGIRHENMILCVPVTTNEFGEWYGFETLTLCYFDTSALLIELLSEDEKKWLNNYHRLVYEKTAPFLSPEECRWLEKKTKSI